jgi:hypothetical protein
MPPPFALEGEIHLMGMMGSMMEVDVMKVWVVGRVGEIVEGGDHEIA